MNRCRGVLVVLACVVAPATAYAQAAPPEYKGPKVEVRVESTPPGAAIYLDDKAKGAVGRTPATLQLAAAPYRILLELAGYKTVDRIVVIEHAQKLAFTLEKQAPPALLDLRPSGDESALGATIWVDGTSLGTVPGRVEVAAGEHLIEVKRTGYQDFRDKLQLAGGETRTLAIVLAPRAKPGAIVVGADVAGAEVWIDGQRRDQAPSVIDGLAEGPHAVEVRKEGLPSWRQTVTVGAGQQTRVTATLMPAQPAGGALKVLSATPGAAVILDGEAAGAPGSEMGDVRPGGHIVEVRAPGFEPTRAEVQIRTGELRVVQFDLIPARRPAAPLVAAAPPFPPPEPTAAAPAPRRAPPPQFMATPPPGSVMAAPSPVESLASQPTRRQEQSTFSAPSIDRLKVNVDFYGGYPYFVGARVFTGIFRYRFIGADVGIELRTNIYETDVGVRPRLQLFRLDPIAFGVDFALFGGGGPTKRDSFNLELGATITLLAGSYVHITLRPYLWYSTDRLCPSVGDIRDSDKDSGTIDPTTHQIQAGSGSLYNDEEAVCKVYDGLRPSDYLSRPTTRLPTQTFGQADPRQRFENTRFMLQGTLEIMATQLLNFWVTIEGAPGQSQRQGFTAKFNSAFPTTDFPLYGRAGISLKF